MNLLIDIGNTKCSLAAAAGLRIRKRYFIRTDRENVRPASLKRLLGKDSGGIDKVVIVSVVPSFLRLLKSGLMSVVPRARVMVVGRDLKVPIPVKYRKPKEVGQDRLVAAYSALSIYRPPMMVIDFGTAVTFDVLGPTGEYEGGLIFPGLRLSLESLEKNAALLPAIIPHPVRGLIGKDTRESMNKGIVLGYAGLCDSIISRFKAQYGEDLKVIATGGDAALIGRYTEGISTVRPDLIFRGLAFLAR